MDNIIIIIIINMDNIIIIIIIIIINMDNIIKEVMTRAKVTSLVCRFWILPWTNGLNTQFKWKLRYSPIWCAYLKP